MYIASVFLPLISFILSFFLYNHTSKKNIDILSCVLIFTELIFYIVGFISINEINNEINIILTEWLRSGS